MTSDEKSEMIRVLCLIVAALAVTIALANYPEIAGTACP